jgi:hypothetical protein
VAATVIAGQSSVRKGAAGSSAWLPQAVGWIIRPAVADGDRIGHVEARHDHRITVDAGGGRVPDPVGAGDQEAAGGRAVRGVEAEGLARARLAEVGQLHEQEGEGGIAPAHDELNVPR